MIQEIRSQEFRSSGVQEFRSQEWWSDGVLEYWTIRKGPEVFGFGLLGRSRGRQPPIGASKQKHYSITPLLH